MGKIHSAPSREITLPLNHPEYNFNIRGWEPEKQELREREYTHKITVTGGIQFLTIMSIPPGMRLWAKGPNQKEDKSFLVKKCELYAVEDE